jgi:hypothetical protein
MTTKKSAKPKMGKFKLKYSKPNGMSTEIDGVTNESAGLLLDMVSAALCNGIANIPGLAGVLTQFQADCDKRRGEYEANKLARIKAEIP